MSKRVLFVAVVIALFFGLPAAYGIGDGNEKVGALPKAQAPAKEMTKEEMLAELKEDLADNDEVFDSVPELKASAGKNGKAIYTYKGTVLDELSKEDLANLYVRLRQTLTRIRTERIQRQLETVRRVERLQRVVAPPQPPQPPRAPSVPPSMPRAPSAPRAPSSPPSAPQRR